MVLATGKFADSEMIKAAARLKTLDKWPVQFISKNELAASGFYFLSKDDWVRCAFCGVQLWDWKPDDEPRFCHKYLSQACRFARDL
jgi:hypothetical protein